MAQFGDFIARLFSPGGTRGLSGDSELVLTPGPENGVYSDLLRKYKAEGELAQDPGLLWATSTSVLRRKGGLGAHLLSQKDDAVANFTDLLVIINTPDARRTVRDPRWVTRATELLQARFADFCVSEDYHLLFPLRPLGVRFLEDGVGAGAEQPLGLQSGEFCTGLLPNLYLGPGESSRPIIAVLANLPGQWQGYREVGRLYSDQLQFTLGSHWLDSFQDASLQQPSLYRLQQYADGSLVHVIHPDLADRYRVRTSTSADGVSVLSVVDLHGRPLCHLILSVVESGMMTDQGRSEASNPPSGPNAFGGPGIQLPTGLPPSPVSSMTMGSHRTVVPLDLDERIFRLNENGALLQRVHFNKFMAGYDVYLSPDGAVDTAMADPAATFQVRGRQVSLVVHRPGVVVDGAVAPVDTPFPLSGNVNISLGTHAVDYRDLSHTAAEGWPYLGEIRRAGGNASLVFGGVYRIGRDKTVKVRLPDEPQNDNIVWLPGMVEGSVIRSRTGDIPKARFYTDSIMVASLHAEVDLRDEPTLISLARHCHTYVRRGSQIIGLSPIDKPTGPLKTTLLPGDEILIGNCVFEVSYPPHTPAEGALSETAPTDMGEYAPPPLAADDLPVAAGLGESGPPPPVPQVATTDDNSLSEPMPARGAKLALAGAGPSLFGDLVLTREKDKDKERERKHGPRLVVDDDFLASLKPRPTPERSPDTAVPGPSTAPPPAASLSSAVTVAQTSSPTLLGMLQVPWVVREEDWQIELHRPARLVVTGWMITGDAEVTNHNRSSVALPENLYNLDQTVSPADYFRLSVRGAQARISRCGHPEASLLVRGESADDTEEVDEAQLIVQRRSPKGDPEFAFKLTLRYDPGLPDPRAQLLGLDLEDRMVQGMFSLGAPLGVVRPIQLGPIRGEILFDGEVLTFSEYLSSYRRPDGSFLPFFVWQGDGPWVTVTEDGQPFDLHPGDRLLAGATLYELRRG